MTIARAPSLAWMAAAAAGFLLVVAASAATPSAAWHAAAAPAWALPATHQPPARPLSVAAAHQRVLAPGQGTRAEAAAGSLPTIRPTPLQGPVVALPAVMALLSGALVAAFVRLNGRNRGPPATSPVAMAATAGAITPGHLQCRWDPVNLLPRVVTFEREVQAQLLHGRYSLLSIVAPGAATSSSTSAAHALPGWDYLGGLVFAIFGLGGPEIAVIVITAGLVLGPKKLAELARDAGKMTGQLKDVTSEFQEAVQEGMREVRETPSKLLEPKPPAAPKAPTAPPQGDSAPTPPTAAPPTAAPPPAPAVRKEPPTSV